MQQQIHLLMIGLDIASLRRTTTVQGRAYAEEALEQVEHEGVQAVLDRIREHLYGEDA